MRPRGLLAWRIIYISWVEVLQLYSNITRGCVIVFLYIFPYGISVRTKSALYFHFTYSSASWLGLRSFRYGSWWFTHISLHLHQYEHKNPWRWWFTHRSLHLQQSEDHSPWLDDPQIFHFMYNNLKTRTLDTIVLARFSELDFVFFWPKPFIPPFNRKLRRIIAVISKSFLSVANHSLLINTQC
jgi:hypothetical protein